MLGGHALEHQAAFAQEEVLFVGASVPESELGFGDVENQWIDFVVMQGVARASQSRGDPRSQAEDADTNGTTLPQRAKGTVDAGAGAEIRRRDTIAARANQLGA